MSAVDDSDTPERHLRLPRRGDKVITAPQGTGCIEGTVVSYAAPRVTLRTDKHGLVHPEIARFTWNKRKKAWVCWPLDVVREVRQLDKIDDRLLKPNLGVAQIGDYAEIEGVGGGWVTKRIGAPTAMSSEGMLFEKLKSYLVSTPAGVIEIDAGNLTYNSERRFWSGRANA